MSSINSILDHPSIRVLIFRASVVEPWRIIIAIHTQDSEKDLHMKGQAEAATGKREGDLKENKPENIQDRHHHNHLPHLLPREGERPPAGQAKVLKIHDRILQAEIHLVEVNARMPGVARVATIIPPILTVSNLPVTVSWIEG